MATDFDEIIDRLTRRKEYDLDLSEVFDSEDLKKSLRNMSDGSRPHSKQNLVKRTDDYYDTKTVQDSIRDNFNRYIDSAKNPSDLGRIRDFSLVRDRSRIQSRFDDKAFDFVKSADKQELSRLSEIRNRVSNASTFDVRIVQRENELIKETPMELKRSELLDLGVAGRSLRKVADNLGLSEDNTARLLEKEGFTITEQGRIKK